ncbi:hypothetical protein C8Q74DRAFT_1373512 [Fomes fomentarius]|nr:hypothetical protein C8Q74DRAFT_1373512 [Fomes fomentarius]
MSHDAALHRAAISGPTALIGVKVLPRGEDLEEGEHQVESCKYGEDAAEGGVSVPFFPPVRDDSGFESCTILYIGNDKFVSQNPDKVQVSAHHQVHDQCGVEFDIRTVFFIIVKVLFDDCVMEVVLIQLELPEDGEPKFSELATFKTIGCS